MQNNRNLLAAFGAFFIPLALFLSLITHPAFAQTGYPGYCPPVFDNVDV